MKERECVDHFEEGRNAWDQGIVGYFVRIRGILLIALADLITMGAPWWWPSSVKLDIQISLIKVLFFLVIIMITFALAAFIYLRHRIRRSLDVKFFLHNFTHHLRDHHVKLNGLLVTKNKNNNISDEYFCDFIKSLCEHTKQYFSRIIYDNTLEVAIRIAVENDKNKIVYRTLGRSLGFNPNRAKHSEDIPYDEGIPGFFMKKNTQGVLFYNDLKKAAEKDTFKLTYNEIHFGQDITTMLVAPINSWDGNSNNMIGLLYITSRKKNIFELHHVDSVKFIADLVAPFISLTQNTLKTLLIQNN